MDWEAFLRERPVAVIATVAADGSPHAVPVEVVTLDGKAYVWCHSTSAKCRNAAREGRAAIVAYKGNEGVLVRGPAKVLDASDEIYHRVTRLFLQKYNRAETYGNDALIQLTAGRLSAFA